MNNRNEVKYYTCSNCGRIDLFKDKGIELCSYCKQFSLSQKENDKATDKELKQRKLNGVVWVWEALDYQVNVDYSNKDKITSVYREYDNRYIRFDDTVILGKEIVSLSFGEVEAISLTTEYLISNKLEGFIKSEEL